MSVDEVTDLDGVYEGYGDFNDDVTESCGLQDGVEHCLRHIVPCQSATGQDHLHARNSYPPRVHFDTKSE